MIHKDLVKQDIKNAVSKVKANGGIKTTAFHKLSVGDIFFTGGINHKGIFQGSMYKKSGKGSGTKIKNAGYHNQRGVDSLYAFSPFSAVRVDMINFIEDKN